MKKYVKNAVKSALSKPLSGRRYRRLLSISVSALLSISTFLTVIPQTETIVYADGDKTITGLCTGTIGDPTPSAGGWSYVYYGTYGGNYVKYRVLDKAATEFGRTTMLLDCDNTLIEMKFASNNSESNSWADSGINAWLNGNDFYNSTDVFTSQEKAAIAASSKSDFSNDGPGGDDLHPQNLDGEHIFLLDAKEATRASYGYPTKYASATRVKVAESWWWLRSPGTPPLSKISTRTAPAWSLLTALWPKPVCLAPGA